MKKLFLIFTLCFIVKINSQNADLSSYKYIVVASNFGFLKSADEHQTSSLTKFLLQKKGFEVLLDTENFPEELSQNKCLALKGTVLDDSNMFSTKSKLQFTDCSGAIIYTSQEGKSKEKDYKKGYHEAIRNAFETMTDFTYSYKPTNVKVTYKIDTVTFEDSKIDSSSFKKVNKPINNTSQYSFVTISKGFQILDNQSKVLFTAIKSSLENIFILKEKNGFLYKKGDMFVVEYYENDEVKSAIFKAPF